MPPSPEAPQLVSKDRPFSAGCVFWFAVIGFVLTCIALFGAKTVRSLVSSVSSGSGLSELGFSLTPSTLPASTVKEFQTVSLGSKAYRLEVVKTDEARNQGLSGRDALLPGTGMLFLFDTADRYSFWMEKMRFPIDIVFLNNGTIVNIANEVQPPKTATEPPATVRPQQLFNQVIEIPAGDADVLGLKVGQKVNL
jgi:uncharacterized membrane protein (UPF0127 family)